VSSNIPIVARHRLVNWLAGSFLLPRTSRRRLYRACGLDLDAEAIISPGCTIYGFSLVMGSGSFINTNTVIDATAPVVIEANVHIGMGCTIATGSHRAGSAQSRAGASYAEAIRIGRGSWLGAGVIVLPGVSIGEGCVIAAGSVVNRDCERDMLYAGVPVRARRRL